MIEASTNTNARTAPPLVTSALILLHLIGYGVVRHLDRIDSNAAVMFRLSNDSQHLAGVVLHPFGETRLAFVLLTVLFCWMLGSRLEARYGGKRLLAVYVAGTLLSGVFYLGFAQLSPDHARVELTAPIGALSAWALGAWRGLKDESVESPWICTSFPKAVGLAAGAVAAAVFFFGGPGATGWLLAGACGSLAWFACVREHA